jgi:hypothetical protein
MVATAQYRNQKQKTSYQNKDKTGTFKLGRFSNARKAKINIEIEAGGKLAGCARRPHIHLYLHLYLYPLAVGGWGVQSPIFITSNHLQTLSFLATFIHQLSTTFNYYDNAAQSNCPSTTTSDTSESNSYTSCGSLEYQRTNSKP